MKTKIICLLVFVVVSIAMPKLATAQIDPPDDPIDTPFDGGVSLLVATAIGYGTKKAYEERKKRKAGNTK